MADVHRVLVHGLQAGVEDDEGEGRHMPDAVEDHQELDRPALREHQDGAVEQGRSAAVMMPSPTNSQRIDSAPITGVMMKGRSETKMIGPRRERTVALSASADGEPDADDERQGDRSVKVSVKRSAL